MKKIISSIIACTFAFIAISCTSNEYLKKEGITVGDSEKMDTLSYVIGCNIGNNIINGIVAQTKADYETIVSTLETAMLGDKNIEVCGVEICEDSIQSLGQKYLGPEFENRVRIAMQDSTAQIYTSEDEKKIISTFFGAMFGYNLASAGLPIQTTWIKAAIEDVNNNSVKIDQTTMGMFMNNYYSVVMPEKNKERSEQWMAMVEKQSGVEKTESGILYKIEEAGDDSIKAVNDEDVVKVLYTGRDFYGEVFDSNRWEDMPEQRKQMIAMYQPDADGKDSPIEFPLNGVIKGWTEGMKLIGKGGKITLWIPAELAYGERGAGQNIGPNQALRFDVELLDVTSK